MSEWYDQQLNDETVDHPLNRVMAQNDVLRNIEHLKAVLAIKEALEEDDYEEACIYLYALTEAQFSALWIAPAKGGIFTTEERTKIKSNEFVSAAADYFSEKDK